MKKNKKLRSGYTTGACAAAAAKVAMQLLLAEQSLNPNVEAIHELPLQHREAIESVEVPFPDKSRHIFKIQDSKIKTGGDRL